MQKVTKRPMVSDRKSVRDCDNCVRKQARWYCAADDAFLCDSCDSSIHEANPLARRHQRLGLKLAMYDDEDRVPSWQKGFTRKARTPRRRQKNIPFRLVPEEVCSEEENEEQLLYRVPVMGAGEITQSEAELMNGFEGILPSEMDLGEFAAEVESLLGKGVEDEAFDMEGLGIFDDADMAAEEWRLKIKDEDDADVAAPEGLGGEQGQNRQEGLTMKMEEEDSSKGLLKLDYNRVMSAWGHAKSPWTTGDRPELNSGDWWQQNCRLGTSGAMRAYGEVVAAAAAAGDRGREARVSRYREKRRARLFSKKIRYEVRKLNAEKRPRMKGRFVKRHSALLNTIN